MFIRFGAKHEVLDLLITVTKVLCDAHRPDSITGSITLYPAYAYSYLSIRNKIKPCSSF